MLSLTLCFVLHSHGIVLVVDVEPHVLLLHPPVLVVDVQPPVLLLHPPVLVVDVQPPVLLCQNISFVSISPSLSSNHQCHHDAFY